MLLVRVIELLHVFFSIVAFSQLRDMKEGHKWEEIEVMISNNRNLIFLP